MPSLKNILRKVSSKNLSRLNKVKTEDDEKKSTEEYDGKSLYTFPESQSRKSSEDCDGKSLYILPESQNRRMKMDDDELYDEFEASLHIEKTFRNRPFGIQGGDGNKDNRSSSIDLDDDSTDGQDFERATVRLDGIEVYAIVSALTCATSISCFDNFQPTDFRTIIRERAFFTLCSELCYYLSGAIGMMTGLHATLIFSLVTMYGRTALGIDRDDAFNDFFGNTGAARFNGFFSFKLSLYCFMAQLTFLITQKFIVEPLRPLVMVLTGYYSYKTMYMDAENVLSAAAVIYSSTPTTNATISTKDGSVSSSESTNGEANSVRLVRRNSGVLTPAPNNRRTVARRSSVKKSHSISTRNFGVDTRQSYMAST